MMRNHHQGFTLIELMIVVAIVGVLASLAISVVETYVTRAKITEGVVAASAAKTYVAEYYAMLGGLPPGGDNEAAGIREEYESLYVESVDWHDQQRIEIEFDEVALGLDGQIEIGLEPVIAGGVIRWRCGQDDNTSEENLKYVPANCRTRYW
jgi:type IV pilus assembly protein PilA